MGPERSGVRFKLGGWLSALLIISALPALAHASPVAGAPATPPAPPLNLAAPPPGDEPAPTDIEPAEEVDAAAPLQHAATGHHWLRRRRVRQGAGGWHQLPCLLCHDAATWTARLLRRHLRAGGELAWRGGLDRHAAGDDAPRRISSALGRDRRKTILPHQYGGRRSSLHRVRASHNDLHSAPGDPAPLRPPIPAKTSRLANTRASFSSRRSGASRPLKSAELAISVGRVRLGVRDRVPRQRGQLSRRRHAVAASPATRPDSRSASKRSIAIRSSPPPRR